MKGWITGKYGTILYTEDGGEIWKPRERDRRGFNESVFL